MRRQRFLLCGWTLRNFAHDSCQPRHIFDVDQFADSQASDVLGRDITLLQKREDLIH